MRGRRPRERKAFVGPLN